eukprot:CAMPEP_0172506810 /NCGR_PEP_ID=MMETSP1066-20121228/198516_1 /TAXON_ID=671091 /ORGANISM="Coscinodiscus wailesii, Strain CCMP2513" /LENGTH=306 /DNA_ID=CAMNT_0013284029 /DNA_START=95 /DNA_END=1015 /DNA_ORIENTATION=-
MARNKHLFKPPQLRGKSEARIDVIDLLNVASSRIESARAVLDEAQQIVESIRVDGMNGSAPHPSLSTSSHQKPTIFSNKAPANDMTKTTPLAMIFHPRDPAFQTAAAADDDGRRSNTDHVVQYTGNHSNDRIAEMKRNLKRRRAAQEMTRTEKRRDGPRRRPRFAHQKDTSCDGAPSEPPHSAYVLYVAQMTAKIKHDRPSLKNQIEIVKKVSRIWNYGMTDDDKEYYADFVTEAKAEYDDKLREFRATGGFEKSNVFEKLGEVGPWVRRKWGEKNDLEREISSYSLDEYKARIDYRLKCNLKKKM